MKNKKAFRVNQQNENYYKLNKTSSDDKKCILKFSMCDDKYPLHNLEKDELKEFVKYAKKVENLEWKEIKIDKGLKYETLPIKEKPQNISRDITIRSMRMSLKSRIIGYRSDEYFYIIWFDNNHKTC